MCGLGVFTGVAVAATVGFVALDGLENAGAFGADAPAQAGGLKASGLQTGGHSAVALSPENLAHLQEHFNMIDVDGDG